MTDGHIHLHHFARVVLGGDFVDITDELGLPTGLTFSARTYTTKIRYRRPKGDCQCGGTTCSDKYGVLFSFNEPEIHLAENLVQSLVRRYPGVRFEYKTEERSSSDYLPAEQFGISEKAK